MGWDNKVDDQFQPTAHTQRPAMTKAEALEHVAAGGCVRRAIPEWDGGASLLRQGDDVVMTDGAAPAIPYENMDPADSADWVAIECR